jgi:hypothetical protein
LGDCFTNSSGHPSPVKFSPTLLSNKNRKASRLCTGTVTVPVFQPIFLSSYVHIFMFQLYLKCKKIPVPSSLYFHSLFINVCISSLVFNPCRVLPRKKPSLRNNNSWVHNMLNSVDACIVLENNASMYFLASKRQKMAITQQSKNTTIHLGRKSNNLKQYVQISYFYYMFQSST